MGGAETLFVFESFAQSLGWYLKLTEVVVGIKHNFNVDRALSPAI